MGDVPGYPVSLGTDSLFFFSTHRKSVGDKGAGVGGGGGRL